MSLRFALLALLRVGPLSGYELQKQFSLSVGHVWHAPDSQIYPELRRMEYDGLLVSEEQTRGERGTRKVYHVTPDGETAFAAWLAEPLDYQRVRDPAHLKAAYLEAASPADARAFFAGHLARHEELLAQWEEELQRIESRTNPMLMRRLAAIPPEQHDRAVAFKRIAYEGLVDRALGEIAWAKRGLELVDRLDPPAAVGAGAPASESTITTTPTTHTTQ